MQQVSVSLLLGVVVFLSSGWIRRPLSVTGLQIPCPQFHLPTLSRIRSLLTPAADATVAAAPAAGPKFCVNCAFYIEDKDKNSKYGKCRMNPVIRDLKYYLVTGVPDENDTEYQFCTIARSRDHMCGKDGKQYVDFE